MYPWGLRNCEAFKQAPQNYYYITIVIIITIVNMTAWCHSIFFECQLGTLFLNHLSYVEQGTQKYVICSRFSILHVNTNLLQHQLLASLYNLYFCLMPHAVSDCLFSKTRNTILIIYYLYHLFISRLKPLH